MNPNDHPQTPMTTPATPTTVTVHLNSVTSSCEVPPTDDLVTSLEQAGIDVPYSCREGDCSACIAKVIEGRVAGTGGDILTPADVDQGYILSCQSRPLSAHVTLSYDD